MLLYFVHIHLPPLPLPSLKESPFASPLSSPKEVLILLPLHVVALSVSISVSPLSLFSTSLLP